MNIRSYSSRKVRLGWALLSLLTLGCATNRMEELESEARPKPLAEPGLSPAALEATLPRVEEGFAARYSKPVLCEAEARRRLEQSREEGWAALKACVAGTHFTMLRTLLEEAVWLQELRTRKDAPLVLAQVVAHRGGSVDGDLRLLHQKRLPIFGLAAAMAQPDAVKGRYVLLRAKVKKFDRQGELTTVRLAEQKLESVGTDVQVGEAPVTEQSSSQQGQLRGNVGMLGKADLKGGIDSSTREARRMTVRHFDNVPADTGREALARLVRPDAFLSVEQEYILLARFDGLRATSGGEPGDPEPPRVPVLTLVSYEVPHPLVVY
jgi:hypothetical protein